MTFDYTGVMANSIIFSHETVYIKEEEEGVYTGGKYSAKRNILRHHLILSADILTLMASHCIRTDISIDQVQKIDSLLLTRSRQAVC